MKLKFSRIRDCVLETARTLPQAGGADLQIHNKSGVSDFVTDVDRDIQKRLIRGLHACLPEAYFLAEESDPRSLEQSVPHEALEKMISLKKLQDAVPEELFVIDPIDGTGNFIYGLMHSCVSVALFRGGKGSYGIVVQPWSGEIYEYLEGRSEYNGRILDRSGDAGIAAGLVGFGTSPYKKETDGEFMRLLTEVFRRCVDLRRMGAAALDICDVAAGKLQLFFEAQLQPWDYAAAKMIAEGAGCKVLKLDGTPLEAFAAQSFVTGTPEAIDDFFNLERVEAVRG